MVFLELRRDPQLTTGNSRCILCWPTEVRSFIRVGRESWGLLSSHSRANRPHLGLCPETNVPLLVQQGSRGCIPDSPGETGIHLEWKQRSPLCSRVATGISGSSLGGLKGVKPPEAFGERPRDWSLGLVLRRCGLLPIREDQESYLHRSRQACLHCIPAGFHETLHRYKW